MNEDERNKHFKGFAELVARDIEALEQQTVPGTDGLSISYGQWKESIRKILAERAYDLVLHTVWNIAPVDLERLFMVEVAAKVPDFDAWPEYGEK